MIGIIDITASLGRAAIICPPGQPLSAAPARTLLLGLPAGAGRWLPPAPSFIDRAELNRPDPSAAVVHAAEAAVVVGFAAAQVIVMVAAAFTVGVRRQHRQLALLCAIGASGRDLARIVVVEALGSACSPGQRRHCAQQARSDCRGRWSSAWPTIRLPAPARNWGGSSPLRCWRPVGSRWLPLPSLSRSSWTRRRA